LISVIELLVYFHLIEYVCNIKTYLCFRLGYKDFGRIKKESHPKGVRKSQYDYDTKHSVNSCCYIDHRTQKKPLGVRQDNMTHYILKKNDIRFCNHMLKYVSKPCLCGSLNHSSTTHTECLLNPKYDDC